MISNLVKDVYSCKNVIKRGKKRRFFRALFKKSRASQAEEKIKAEAESSFEVTVDLRKVRIVCYDSVEIEAKRSDSARGKNN